MKRRNFLHAVLIACATPAFAAPRERFSHGLLWRVTRKDAAPSHVYGTIHVADPRLAALPARVQKVFDAATSLMLEFLPDSYTRERFLKAAMFLDEQTLEQKIGAEDFERALVQLAPIGLPREFVNKMKPWGVLLNLHQPKRPQGVPLDALLLEQARAPPAALPDRGRGRAGLHL